MLINSAKEVMLYPVFVCLSATSYMYRLLIRLRSFRSSLKFYQRNICEQGKLTKFWKSYTSRFRSSNFKSTLQHYKIGHFRNLAHVSRRKKTNWICVKILSLTYLWTRNSTLGLYFGSHLDPDRICLARGLDSVDCLRFF